MKRPRLLPGGKGVAEYVPDAAAKADDAAGQSVGVEVGTPAWLGDALVTALAAAEETGA